MWSMSDLLEDLTVILSIIQWLQKLDTISKLKKLMCKNGIRLKSVRFAALENLEDDG
jgi:hypothetical protein